MRARRFADAAEHLQRAAALAEPLALQAQDPDSVSAAAEEAAAALETLGEAAPAGAQALLQRRLLRR
jgi:hypothetical protein